MLEIIGASNVPLVDRPRGLWLVVFEVSQIKAPKWPNRKIFLILERMNLVPHVHVMKLPEAQLRRFAVGANLLKSSSIDPEGG